MASAKDIIYIDIDEEITGIIDKVQSSKEKIVALVLPKRAAVLQSIVNMKLLKKTADQAKKNIVLITSDNNLLPLAGMVGFYVAKTLQTRPVVPPAPQLNDDTPLSVSEETDLPADAPVDATLPVGALAGLPPESDEEEEIELDNADAEPTAEDAAAAATAGDTKDFNKKLKVPNFERFRLLLVGGAVLLIALIVGIYFALTSLPKATITIKTDTSNVPSDITFTASTTAQAVDTTNLIVPAALKTDATSNQQQVTTTGQQDQGTKATGTMTLTNCINDGVSHTIPAGTTFSSGQFVYATDTAVTLDPALYSGSVCKSASFGLSKADSVTATQAGDSYNLSARNYNSSITGISAAGSNMTGGTSKLVKVVAQADVDNAKQKILDSLSAAATSQIEQQFQRNNGVPLPDTLTNAAPVVTTSANVGDQADLVTVTVNVTYSMLGVQKSDLSTLVKSDVGKHIDISKQQISNDGVNQATIKILDKSKPAAVVTEIQTTATAGAEQNADAIRQLVAGKKSGDAQATIQSRPGIENVVVKLSPFWVTHVPTKPAKVTVIFQSTNGK